MDGKRWVMGELGLNLRCIESILLFHDDSNPAQGQIGGLI